MDSYSTDPSIKQEAISTKRKYSIKHSCGRQSWRKRESHRRRFHRFNDSKSYSKRQKYRYKNVEFRYGDIESLPIDDNSIDVILSNCVINLVPNKSKAFNEAYRVLRKGGRMYISDIVLLQDLSDDLRKNEMFLVSCIAGAILKEDYLKIIKYSGFDISKPLVIKK